MNTRISMLAATAAVTTLPLLLAGCGSNAQPQSPSAPPASQAASQAAPSTAPATETPASPSSAPSSSSAPTQEAGEITAASEKWVKTVLTIGYPDASSKPYLARIKPLMTGSGFAIIKKSADSQLDKGLKTLNKTRSRSTPKFTSDAKVSSVSAEKATTKQQFVLTTQKQSGDTWKTVRSRAEETVTVQLVNEGGKWLVEEAT